MPSAPPLGDDLERDVLEGRDPMPHHHRPAGVKDGGLQLLGALGSQLGERASALVRVCLVDEHERLAHLQRGADLAQAVRRAQVAPRQEAEHHLRATNVRLQLSDVFEVVDVEEDLAAGQELLQLVLDDGDGVLQGRKAQVRHLLRTCKAVGQGGGKPAPCSRRG